MSKYHRLWEYIRENGSENLQLSFEEIRATGGVEIDHSFLNHKKELMEFGYQVGKISLKGQTVQFHRIEKNTSEMLKGIRADLMEVAGLYDDLNDYLASHTNHPGWIKGLYPNRETAEDGIAAGNLFVLRRDGRIAGTIILNHEPEEGYESADWKIDLDYKDIIVIHTFAVHPLYLKQGIGMEILEWVMDRCRETGIKAIRLDTYNKNMPAIELYRKCGFQYIDTVDLGYGEHGLELFELYQKIL